MIGSDLPPAILALALFTPMEDLILHVLRDKFGDAVRVQSLIEDDQTFPAVIVRRTPDWGSWSGDARFIDTGQLTVQTLCGGINADSDAALLAEAVRNALRRSVNEVVQGLGHLTQAEMTSSPRRATDWATSTGPVQYADLPTGVVRYETVYEVAIKKAL